MVNIKTAYEPHDRVTTPVGTTSRTQQNMAAETDINSIMSRYKKTGVLTHISAQAAQYGDFSEVPDYHAGLQILQESQDLFMELPAALRAEFNNDPGAFVAFATDPENLDKMRELGLAPKLPPASERTPLGEGGAILSAPPIIQPDPSDPQKQPS